MQRLSVVVDHPLMKATDGTVTVAARLDAERQARLREHCRELLPEPPFVLTSSAWAARALV